MQDITKTLARRVVESRYEDMPAPVLHEASRALLNWCACAIGGSRHETVERALAAVTPFAGPAQAGVLGRRERMDILNAALVNGISSHVLDFDDTQAEAIHPSSPVFPALLALAEWRGFSGAELAHAFVLGVEVECRVGRSVFPQHYDAGWHITGTAGIFGAAAAAGKLLGLDARQMAWALGMAATQSAGLREMFGSMCKCLHPGRAAQNGLHAALLAREGFTSSEQGLEAKRGFGHVLSSRFDPSAIADGWGARYELSSNMYKPFACGLVAHGVIDGCIQLRDEHALRAGLIEQIDLKVAPLVLELMGKTAPRTGLEGKFSVFHAAAVALVHGAGGEAQFSDAAVLETEVAALRGRVRAAIDDSLLWTQAHVAIRLRDGRTLERHVAHPLGSLERPMSDADLEQKFHALTGGVLAAPERERLARLCWALTALPDAGVIARAAVS
ncbi:MAG: MmgE/PrpD family protein [Burkholderiales bacterium]|nr:MmgE/PrpD family protein [Burkholderiales bacterium]MCW5604125.1 MmgE/PrpD family protein [Burkholderiales bacterium]